jgi:hypothetical protein
MNEIEDRLRAAATAAANTVTPGSAPPLRLPAPPRRLPPWTVRRPIAAAASAAAVIAITIAAAVVAPTWLGGHGQGPAQGQDALSSVPPYYMTLVPGGPGRSAGSVAVVRSTVTGKTLATIRPPAPYITFIDVSGAADDRTFVLTAQSTQTGSLSSADGFYEARFDPATQAVSLTRLALPGLPLSNDFVGDALSPDGTELAVASDIDQPAQIDVYSLPSGAVRVWKAGSLPSFSFASNLISWSGTGVAFQWNGTGPAGEYLLNTGGPGGSLLADSRLLVCLMTQNSPFSSYGYPTPDGSSIIVPVDSPVAPGQSARCAGPTPPASTSLLPARPGAKPSSGPAAAQLEEFSAATRKAIGVIYTGPSGRTGSAIPGLEGGYGVFWSSDSGSVLVIDAPPAAGQPDVYGVLSGGVFTPIPGALVTSPDMAAF